MVQDADGQQNSIRAKFVRRCYFSGSHELQFLNMQKAFYSFYRNLAQLSAEKTTSKDLQNVTVFIWRFIFCQHCRHSRCYIYFRGRFFLSLAGGRHVLFSCQFSAVYLSFDIQSICSFNTYGYYFSFHRCMMKESTIVSSPDFQFQLLTFNDISQVFRVESSDIRCIIILSLRTISRSFSFFLFHFQKGYNKTQSEEFKCCMYSRPHAKPTANNNLSILI